MKNYNSGSNTQSQEYFLSGRSMPLWAVGASLFASNIGTEHFVGQAGSAAASGIAVGMYEWTAILLLLALGWVFAPSYLGYRGESPLTTVPEWFERRFDSKVRIVLVSVTLLCYIISKTAISIYAGSVLFQVVLGWDLWSSAPVILVLTGAYTIMGGLTAVIMTDVVQMFIFLFGGCLGTVIAFSKIGGWNGLVSVLDQSQLSYFMHWNRGIRDADFPATGLWTGLLLNSVWYWVVDQEMVQRVLSAKNLTHAQGGLLMAGYLKLLPMFIIVFPGIIARAMYEKCILTSGQDFSRWCQAGFRTGVTSNDQLQGLVGSDGERSNLAFPLLVVNEFPEGVVGLILASMMAALMSSLSAVLNSASTLFTMDIYQRFINPSASQARLVTIGRIVVSVMIIFSLLWLPVIASQKSQLYLVNQSFVTTLAPSISTVFLLGFFTRYVSARGAFWGLIIGFVLGIARMTQWILWADECSRQRILHEDTSPTIGGNGVLCMAFLHFTVLLALLVACITVGVSWVDHYAYSALKQPTDVPADQEDCRIALNEMGANQLVTDDAVDVPDISKENPVLRRVNSVLGCVLLITLFSLIGAFQ